MARLSAVMQTLNYTCRGESLALPGDVARGAAERSIYNTASSMDDRMKTLMLKCTTMPSIVDRRGQRRRLRDDVHDRVPGE